MKRITDSKEREWIIDLNAKVIRDVCKMTKITLADLTVLEIEVSQIMEALPIICQKQMKERGLSPDDLLETLSLFDIQNIFAAIMEDLQTAFPSIADTGGGKSEGPLDRGQ